MPHVAAPRALVRIENDALEVNIPDAEILLAPGRTVPLKGGLFTAAEILGDTPLGEIGFTSQTSLGSLLELIDQLADALFEELPRDGVDGKLDGKIKVSAAAAGRRGDERHQGRRQGAHQRRPRHEGRRPLRRAGREHQHQRHGEGRRRQRRDAHQRRARQGRLAADLRCAARQAAAAAPDGDARQHRPHPARPRHQSHRAGRGADRGHDPARASATSRRSACAPTSPTPSSSLENVSWRKPPGRSATLQCDIATGRTHKIELQNFKVAGDDIAIEGWAAIDADNRLREFYFPDFSLNVITRMEVQGTLRQRRRLAGEGARAHLRRARLLPLAVLARAARRAAPQGAEAARGLDLEAEIGTVIGFNEVSLRSVKMKLSKRGEKLTSLDVRGTLDGGKPLAVVLQDEPGQAAQAQADSTDAGQAFKLIDFYPKDPGRPRAAGGQPGRQGRRRENRHRSWVEDFRILGDPVVSEVFSGAEEAPQVGRAAAQEGTPGDARGVRLRCACAFPSRSATASS